jgi:hypothetical protein
MRLVHRAAGGFEFVHDQMLAYLAARWFAQDGFGVAELEKMVASSTIWTHAAETRRTLWGFAAALLDDAAVRSLSRKALRPAAETALGGLCRSQPSRYPYLSTLADPMAPKSFAWWFARCC